MTVPTPEPRIQAFEKLAYGLFLHWGLYSVQGQGEWYRKRHAPPSEQYEKLMDAFKADSFDAVALARWARKAGFRYITLTTRHHEGFSLYDTRGLNDFDAPHSPAGRDLIGEFVEACRSEDMLPMFYHTTLDWRWDTEHCTEKEFAAYLDYLVSSVEILCTYYGPIGGLWFDGNWSRKADWQEDRLYSTIRRLQPEAMIINNSSVMDLGAVGHPELDSVTYEQGRPEPINREGAPKYLAAEMCQTMNNHWGHASRDFRHYSPADIIRDLCACRRVGANFLMNAGPMGSGELHPYDKATLERVGEWIGIHAIPIYQGRPTACSTQGKDFVLEAGGRYYLFVHDLTVAGNQNLDGVRGAGWRLVQGIPGNIKSARWVDNGEELEIAQEAGKDFLGIRCTNFPYGTHLVVRVAEITPSIF